VLLYHHIIFILPADLREIEKSLFANTFYFNDHFNLCKSEIKLLQ